MFSSAAARWAVVRVVTTKADATAHSTQTRVTHTPTKVVRADAVHHQALVVLVGNGLELLDKLGRGAAADQLVDLKKEEWGRPVEVGLSPQRAEKWRHAAGLLEQKDHPANRPAIQPPDRRAAPAPWLCCTTAT
jgi:hypothetical protein